MREIILAHELNAGPLTAVRNVVIQFSLGQLQANGVYERYVERIPQSVLTDLLSRLSPGWIPVDLAMAHYEACNRLALGNRAAQTNGAAVGNRLQETTLVSSAKKVRDDNFDLWQVQGQLNRMWRRLNRGGSMQVVKAGPKVKLIEQIGIPLNRIAYYRDAQVAAISAAHSALGVRVIEAKLESVSTVRDETVYSISWE